MFMFHLAASRVMGARIPVSFSVPVFSIWPLQVFAYDVMFARGAKTAKCCSVYSMSFSSFLNQHCEMMYS
jgi:hypothetical protein